MRLRSLMLLLFVNASAMHLQAQTVEEPPIPVTIICPYHEDSLRQAYEAGRLSPSGERSRHLDSISASTIRAAESISVRMERSFTYLYLLLGLLALISLAALRTAYRLRLELQDLRNEQRISQLPHPSPIAVSSHPEAQERLRPTKPASTPRTQSRPRKGTKTRPT